MPPVPAAPVDRTPSLLRLLVLVFAAIGLATSASAQGTRPSDRHLHGVIEHATRREPVPQAEVSVEWGGDPANVRRTRTDRNGRFDVRDLPAREVRLRVRALGFSPLSRLVDLTAGDVLLKLELRDTVATLEQVAVEAARLADALERVARVNTLDADALAATRGQTLGETIKNLPGVSVIQFGPSIAKPVIRGLNSQRVLVMNAGLRQEDQQWGTEHAPNLDSFDADAVTVVRGAATVLYGADALGGVVRMQHAEVPDTGARARRRSR